MQVEMAEDPIAEGQLTFDGFSDQEVLWHIDLMAAHGLLDASVTKAWGGQRVAATIDGLTWEGLDMLDAMRSPRVWEGAKDAIKKSVGSTTMDVVKVACSKIATEMVLGALG